MKKQNSSAKLSEILDCGGKAGATTPLSPARGLAVEREPSLARMLRRRCALPEHSKTLREFRGLAPMIVSVSFILALGAGRLLGSLRRFGFLPFDLFLAHHAGESGPGQPFFFRLTI